MGEKQVNYLEKIREAFGCADIDVDERVKNVNIHLSVAPSSLPNEAGLTRRHMWLLKAACLRMYLFLSRLRLQKVLRTGIYRSIALRNLLMIF